MQFQTAFIGLKMQSKASLHLYKPSVGIEISIINSPICQAVSTSLPGFVPSKSGITIIIFNVLIQKV